MNLKRGYKCTLQLTQEEMAEYGEFFKSMRLSIGLNLEKMAALLKSHGLNVFRTTISRWEKGLRVPNQDIEEIEQVYREAVKGFKIAI
jgi:transcriptional regulator with XRE-family HTH domain